MTELIERKNYMLKQAGDDLVKISEIGAICEDVEFSKASAATAFIRLVGDAIGRLTLNRYEISSRGKHFTSRSGAGGRGWELT